MNTRLQVLFDSIETQRQELLSSLQDLPYEKLNQHRPGKWSINQIIAHLITAEELSVRYLEKKMLGIDQTKDTGIVEELKMTLLQISQRLPFRFKAPAKVIENTPDEKDIKKLGEKWNAVRLQWKDMLEKIGDHQIKRGIYRHVRVGMINIQQALKFFSAHVIHHKPQIERQL